MSTILIIEDEPELVKVLRSYLEQAGFNVLSAGRGDTGLATWESKRPDLVVLDLSLPGMTAGCSMVPFVTRMLHPSSC
jgi:two-component system alkaline phosphatase synthesis response regulator PhoP